MLVSRVWMSLRSKPSNIPAGSVVSFRRRRSLITRNTAVPDSGEPRALTREYPNLPLVGVGAVVVHAGRVLLIRRAKPPRQGEWSLPGGLQKLGETVFEAAHREGREET